MNAETKVIRARSALVTKHPFWGTLALHMGAEPRPDIPTMATDGRKLYYSPAFVGELTELELIGVLAHEISHCTYKHHVRRGGRDPKLWNIAADYAINRDLIAAGFTLPKGALLDSRYDGLGAEEIYSALERQQGQQSQGGKSQQSQGQGGQAQQSPQGQPSQGQPGQPSPAPQSGGQSQPGPAQGGGDPASVPDYGRCGAVLDAAPDHAPAERAQAEADWDVKVRQALAVAKAAGELPGGLKRLADALAKPRVDWRDELRRFIEQSVVRDYSWQRPNRRHLGAGYVLPGLVSDSLAHLVVIVDTSGSIDRKALSQFRAEIDSALQEGAADRLTVVYADTGVHGTAEFARGDVLEMDATGKGGTDFRAAFQWVQDNAPDATAIVYFTDLETRSFGEEPAAPVMWAGYGDPRKLRKLAERAPFGDLVTLN